MLDSVVVVVIVLGAVSLVGDSQRTRCYSVVDVDFVLVEVGVLGVVSVLGVTQCSRCRHCTRC